MACCAAAIFIICQIIYAVRRALSFVTGGAIPAVSGEVIEGNAAARWTLEYGAPAVAVRSWKTRRAGYLAAAFGVVMLSGLWIATKPDAPGPFAGAGPMARVHLMICGPGVSKDQRAAMERALASRFSSNNAGLGIDR